MKNVAIVILILFFYGCGTQKMIKEYKHPKTKTTMKKLDVESLEKIETKVTETYEVRVNRTWVSLGRNYLGSIKGGGYSSISYKKVNFKTKDEIEIIRNGAERYRYIKTNPDKDIKEWYLFYVNGNLERGGKYFVGKQYKNSLGRQLNPYEFEIGVWNSYDYEGNLIDSIDYDSLFRFTFEDVLNFINENEMNLVSSGRAIRKSVNRKTNHAEWRLYIEISDDEKKIRPGVIAQYYLIALDGNTGKLISKEFRGVGYYVPSDND